MVSVVSITGGKGGTGKSTIATSLATYLAKNNRVLLVDLDVECPDDHYILNIDLKKIDDIFQMVPKFDNSKCIKCGKCAEVCSENAIVLPKNNFPLFFPEQCIGCKACLLVCNKIAGAISEGKKKIGFFSKGSNYGVDLIAGFVSVGKEESSPVVKHVKKYVESIKKNYDYVIIDTAAGMHCTVIHALEKSDFAFAVTEPTPFGAHDLGKIGELLNELKIPFEIVLNRSDVGDKKLIGKIAEKLGSEITSKIPYSTSIAEAYAKGEIVRDEHIRKLAQRIEAKMK